jgi:hypothetical protein
MLATVRGGPAPPEQPEPESMRLADLPARGE